jgi:hypothetical protein
MKLAEAAMANLNDLAKVSKEINKRSDEVNQILKDLEKKLVAMNLGVEAWLLNQPLKSQLTVRPYEDRNGEEQDERFCIEEVLGFGCWGDRYALLVKQMTYEEDFQTRKLTKLKDEEDPRLLLQSSRDLRIEALNHIEALLDELVREARRIVQAIEKGRKTVDNL